MNRIFPFSIKARKCPVAFVFLSLFLLFLGAIEASAQLFDSDELLHLSLNTNLAKVLDDLGEEAVYHPASIKLQRKNGEDIAFAVKVKTRGNSRQLEAVCSFPPLFVKFPKEGLEGTLFEGQHKLKLVTHCRPSQKYQQYLLKEYLIYKMYTALTKASFRVRLVQITYKDVAGKRKDSTRLGFFIEDVDDMANREECRELNKEEFKQYPTVGKKILLSAMFEYMIGNTDWGLSNLHNVKMIIREGAKEPTAVPYDFDWCGLVNAPYAIPHPKFGTTSVRERVYQGFCHTDKEFNFVFKFFHQRKEQLYHVINDCKLLDEKVRKDCLDYLESFYKTIDDPAKVKQVFYENCGD